MGRGNNASVAAALAAYRSGRAADARGIAEEVWSGSSDAAAACLLALLEMEAGRLESALAWNDRACTADPRDPRYATQGARLATLKGDHVAAFDRFATLLRSAPRTTGVWSELVLAARASGQYRAASEIVIFTHGDVESRAADVGGRLVRRLGECDVLGIAGATRATGPAWLFAGWPYLHGSVIYPDGSGYRVTAYSRTVPVAHSIR